MLTASAILQLEQRKGNKRNGQGSGPEVPEKFLIPELIQLATLETTSRVLMAAAEAAHIKCISIVSIVKGEMTYVNAEYFWRKLI